MPPREYSSANRTAEDANEILSTEGFTFTLDKTEFECHGEFDGQDMIDLAVPMSDAGDGWYDPEALAAVGRFYRQVLGEETYRAFAAHRRRHRTPPSVVAAIMMDLIGDIVNRPPAKPSPSPSGRPTIPASSAAASPSPAVRSMRSPAGPAVDPAGIIPPEMAEEAEVLIVPAPAGQAADPMAGMSRVVNLGNAARTTVEPAAN